MRGPHRQGGHRNHPTRYEISGRRSRGGKRLGVLVASETCERAFRDVNQSASAATPVFACFHLTSHAASSSQHLLGVGTCTQKRVRAAALSPKKGI